MKYKLRLAALEIMRLRLQKMQDEEVMRQYEETAAAAELTRIALESLPAKERQVLDRFYINRESGHVDRLCEELGYETSNVYRMKNRALGHFAEVLYGSET
jgi:ArpU family phage transcriptional regulator